MGWFTRRAPRPQPDPALPMFGDAARAARFVALAGRVLAERGLECTYDHGHFRAADGRSFGLVNLAQLVAASPEREWADLVVQHVDGLLAAYAAPRQRDLALVRDRLYLRLWQAEDLSVTPEAAERLGPDLVGLAALDHPDHVETIAGAEDLDRLGGWAGVREAALANLGRLAAEETSTLGPEASRVQVSVGGFFHASRVALMRRTLREDFLLECPPQGVLFVVPNRHLIAVHPMRGAGMFEAVGRLIALAAREHEVPGAISPHVWFWHDGAVQRVTRFAGDGAIELHVNGPLQVAMTDLGLVDEA